MNAFQAAREGAHGVTPLWPAPDMSILGGGRSKSPPMPTEIFGTTWPLISDLAEGASSPVDYVAISVLAVAASLIGGKYRVSPWQGWDEPCILWTAVVGDPSTNKSPGIDAATSPLRSMEHDHASAFDSVLRDYETRVERAKAERREWEGRVKEATKESLETPKIPEAAVVPDEPQRRRLLVQDATPEAVGAILSGNPFGTLHLRDELAGWLMSFDRYSPGGREFWLEAYGGRPHIIDRKGEKKSIRIPFNGVTVLGGIQPEKLGGCLLGGYDDGLVARFLWAWPDPIPFHRPKGVADKDRLENIYRRLDGLQTRMNPFTYQEEAVVLRLSDKAADVFEAWVCETSASVGDETASLFKGFCGKLRGTALRIALASELLVWADGASSAEPEEVSAVAMVAAIEFIESYAKPTALRVFGDAALPAVERNAAMLARHVQKYRMGKLNARDVRRASGIAPPLKDALALDEAIEVLIEADWLRPVPGRAGENPGRNRKDYLVNPGVHEV